MQDQTSGDEIQMEYEIIGEPMPAVVCALEAGESMKCEKGAMAWMTPNMVMETTSGGIGQGFKRALSGESFWQNVYTAKDKEGLIAFASSFVGHIRAVSVTPGREILAQKTAYLCSQTGVDFSMVFQKKLSSGFFGGEGFVLERLSGNGVVFLEIDGAAQEYDLDPGESIIVDTGRLAYMDATVTFSIERIRGAKNVLFGGEGLTNTVLTGPGKVVLQTMPLSTFCAIIKDRLSD